MFFPISCMDFLSFYGRNIYSAALNPLILLNLLKYCFESSIFKGFDKNNAHSKVLPNAKTSAFLKS
jgi:hypothetical protein